MASLLELPFVAQDSQTSAFDHSFIQWKIQGTDRYCFRMVYQEFKARYNILGAKEVAKAKNDKSAAGAVLELVKLDKDKYRLGHTKIFFRAGIGGWMEEQRENKIGSVLAWLQAGARGKASRMQFKKLQDQVSNPSEHGSLFILFFSTEIGVVLMSESSSRLHAGKNLEVAPDLDGHQVGDFLLSLMK